MSAAPLLARRIAPRASGFTLLEMIIVLVIISLMMGMAVMRFDSVTAQQDLRRPVTEFQQMTLEAVRRASLYERPQFIYFDAKGFLMRYRNDANGRADDKDSAIWQRRVDLPSGMKLSLRRFGSEKFAPAAGQRLSIAPGGLCEPISARFEKGAAWIEILLDPLSGGVSDEAMNIP
ncbi:MAG: pilus assembly FimT family protein [Roseimicrobium sp.]